MILEGELDTSFLFLGNLYIDEVFILPLSCKCNIHHGLYTVHISSIYFQIISFSSEETNEIAQEDEFHQAGVPGE